jgi:outer membrane protein assembly factor BamA
MAEVSAAFVGDTAVSGPLGPILGSRYRFEVAPAIGDLSLTRLLLDYRRYVMPVRPYTLATRVMHFGQYGADAGDPRVAPTFLGSRYFVRGYGWSSLRCQWNAEGECTALDELLGKRVLVGNVEVRAPLAGVRSRDLKYGPLPIEGFLFADTGLVWSRSIAVASEGDRRLIGSVGAGVRLGAFGLPIELAGVRALTAPARGWSFELSFRPSF